MSRNNGPAMSVQRLSFGGFQTNASKARTCAGCKQRRKMNGGSSTRYNPLWFCRDCYGAIKLRRGE